MGATLVKQSLSLLLIALVARESGPEALGIYAKAVMIVAVFSLLNDLGFSQAVLRGKVTSTKVNNTLFLLNIIFSAFSFLFLVVYSIYNSSENELVEIIVLLSFGNVLATSAAQFAAIANRNEKWNSLSKLQAFSNLSSTLVCIVAVYFTNFNVQLLAVQIILSNFIVLVGVVKLNDWRPKLEFDFKESLGAIRYGVFFSMFSVFLTLQKQVEVFGLSINGKLLEIGIYNRAQQLVLMPNNVVTGPLGNIFIPIFSREKNDGFEEVLNITIDVFFVLSLTISTFLFIFAPEVVHLVLGEQFSQSIQVVKNIAFGLPAIMLMTPMSWVVMSRKSPMLMAVWGVAILVTYSLFLIPTAIFGNLGHLAIMYSMVSYVSLCIFSLLIFGENEKHLRKIVFRKTILLLVFSAAMYVLLEHYFAELNIAGKVLIYFAFLLIFFIKNKKVINLVLNIKRSMRK